MKEKELYVSPLSDEVELTLEGCIATSIPDFLDGGNLFDL